MISCLKFSLKILIWLINFKISKQVFKERQPFQAKTPTTTTFLQTTKQTKALNMRLFLNENNVAAAATSSFKSKGKFNNLD